MILFSIDIYIKTINQLLLDNVKEVIPFQFDSRIISDLYLVQQVVDQFDDLPILSGMIRFNSDTDRQVVFDEVMAVDGIFTGCEVGSYIKFHDCNLPNENKTDRQCFDEIVFEVVS